jgi:signal transduction histidine kinase
MTWWPFSHRRLQPHYPRRVIAAAPAVGAALLTIATATAVLARSTARPGRQHPSGRRGSDTSDDAGSDVIAALADVGDAASIALRIIALQAQALTGAELAAVGLGGDATRPFQIWVSTAAAAVPVASFLGVPIRFRGRVVGCVCVANKRDSSAFTPENQQMAELLASRAGRALEQVRIARLAGALAWLQSVMNQTPDGVLVVNRHGHVTLQNRALAALVRGGPLDLRFPSGERVPPGDDPLARALADRETTIGRELQVVVAGDRPVTLLVSAAPIAAADGSLNGALMVCQEVSTVRELERVRQEWSSIVAHELRQPISVISVRSSLLLHGPLSARQRDNVAQIARSANSLGRMVTDLLDASLLETDRLRVTLDRLDLTEFLRDVVARTALTAGRTRTVVPGVRLYVRGDAQRLEQVISNVLSNAAKYAAPDTDIDVELSQLGDQAHICVTNVGDPIPHDELPFVFNRFFRARTVGAKRAKGLGLGLYIAKGLVTAHHGRMWAESVPAGASFHIALPLDGPPVPLTAFAADHIATGKESP